MEGSEVINFSALEKELQAALEADKKYRRENDAKFRAIHQNVGSYEEFRWATAVSFQAVHVVSIATLQSL